MGTSLSGSKISDKFQFLIKTAESAISSSLTNIEDGAGNASDLSISNNKVKVGTALGINQSSPTFSLDINGTGSAVRVDNGTNASLLVGKGSTFGFCAGDCNPATTVGVVQQEAQQHKQIKTILLLTLPFNLMQVE